jgi:hypothetical protein
LQSLQAKSVQRRDGLLDPHDDCCHGIAHVELASVIGGELRGYQQRVRLVNLTDFDGDRMLQHLQPLAQSIVVGAFRPHPGPSLAFHDAPLALAASRSVNTSQVILRAACTDARSSLAPSSISSVTIRSIRAASAKGATSTPPTMTGLIGMSAGIAELPAE